MTLTMRSGPMSGGYQAWQTMQDPASMGSGMKSSPCRACPHFGTPPSKCRDYHDCLLAEKQSISCYVDPNKPDPLETPTKFCKGCGKPFEKKREWTKKYWDSREYCTFRCKKQNKPKDPIPTKICKGCGKPFQLQKGWSLSYFKRREYCTPACKKLHQKEGSVIRKKRKRTATFENNSPRYLTLIVDGKIIKLRGKY